MSATQKPKEEGSSGPLDASAAAPLLPYPAGSIVRETGIYVLQHTCSRPPQNIAAIRGQRFPTCAQCIGGGAYTLKLAAPLPEEDPDFRPEA